MNGISSVLFGVLLLINTQLGVAQGVIEGPVGKAEDLFLEYVVARHDLQRQFVVVGMGENVKTDLGKNRVFRVDLKLIDARLDGAQRSRFTTVRFRKEEEGRSSSPVWEQIILLNGKKHLRRGSTGLRRGSMTADEDADVDVDKARVSRVFPVFDPYFFILADTGTYLKSLARLEFAERILQISEIKSATFEEGLIVAKFRFPNDKRWILTIAFDEKQGGRPVDVTWRHRPYGKRLPEILKKGEITEDDFFLMSRCKASWEQKSMGAGDDSEKVWLPRHITRLDVIGAEQDDLSEFSLVLNWEAMKSEDFPDPDDEDWKEAISNRFKIDWEMPFAEFSRRNGISEH